MKRKCMRCGKIDEGEIVLEEISSEISDGSITLRHAPRPWFFCNECMEEGAVQKCLTGKEIKMPGPLKELKEVWATSYVRKRYGINW